MKVSVGDVSARCLGCGGTEFEPAEPGELRLDSVLACAGCGARSSYEQMLNGIGEEAMRRVNEAMEALKKRSRRPRKPKK